MAKQKQRISITQKQSINENQIKDLSILSTSFGNLVSQLSKASDEIPYLTVKNKEFNNEQTLDWIPNQSSNNLNKTKLINEFSLQIKNPLLLDVIIYLIQNLNEHGFISDYKQLLEQNQYPPSLLNIALKDIQKNGPAGIGARNVKEFLTLQIEDANNVPAHTLFVINNYLEDIANRNFQRITKNTHISNIELKHILSFIQKLKPSIDLDDNEPSAFIIPEVYISLTNSNQIQVSLINENQLEFEFDAPQMSTNDSEMAKFISSQRHKAKSLERSYHRREETLLLISNVIAKKQAQFFKTNGKKLNTLTKQEVANETNFNISTISRTTKDKYFQCEFGVFPLSRLFSSRSVNNLSQGSILNSISEIIESEDKTHPLSDQKIVNKLKTQKIDISRRTVAKYRKKLLIPNQFKRIQ